MQIDPEFSALGTQSPWQAQGGEAQSVSPKARNKQATHNHQSNTTQANTAKEVGGIRLEGERQQHPGQGVDLERDVADRQKLARERIRQLKAHKQQQEPEMENHQLLRDEQEYYEREQRDQEQQRRQRQQQMGRQRTMEQSRHPGGGGLPL